MKDFLYESVDGDGQTARGSLVAVSVADARFQLTRMGHRQIRILSSEMLPINIPNLDDPAIAALAVQSQSDSLARAVLRIFTGNWLLWLPLGAVCAWSWYQGPPFTVGDYVSFGLFAVALLVVVILILPTVLFQQVMSARVFGRFRAALFYLACLRHLNLFGLMPKLALVSERSKMLAGLGRVDEAKAALQDLDKLGSEHEVATARIALADALHDHDEMIRLLAAQSERHPDKAEYRVDLALALARYSDRLDEAGRLLAAIHPSTLPDMYAAGAQFARGILAQRQGDHATALRELPKAQAVMAKINNALGYAIVCEIRGYLAISLKATGQREQADQLWRQAWTVLQHHDGERWRRLYGAD